jgi:hypothetical protein
MASPYEMYALEASGLINAREFFSGCVSARGRRCGLCEVLSGAAGLDFVLMHVLLLGHGFEVLEPPELGRRCRALAQRLLSAGAGTA